MCSRLIQYGLDLNKFINSFMLLKSILESKNYSYVGDCITSFYDDSCTFYNYNDATDFAQGEENAKPISKRDFLKNVRFNEVVDECDIFLYDEQHDVYLAYDSHKDIHYFFIK